MRDEWHLAPVVWRPARGCVASAVFRASLPLVMYHEISLETASNRYLTSFIKHQLMPTTVPVVHEIGERQS
jgi:hypothetical protein